MCGIVGLFLKDKSLEPQLGAMLSEMLISLSDRGPDSAGIAIYGAPPATRRRSPSSRRRPSAISAGSTPSSRRRSARRSSVAVKSTHAVVTTTTDKVDEAREAIETLRPSIRIMGAGEVVEIYKEVGLPRGRRRPLRRAQHGRHAWHRPHPHGHGVRR